MNDVVTTEAVKKPSRRKPMKLKTIKDLYEKIKKGKIDESKLEILIDYDKVRFFLKSPRVDEEPAVIDVEGAIGYYDIDPLYKLLFPKAEVSWL